MLLEETLVSLKNCGPFLLEKQDDKKQLRLLDICLAYVLAVNDLIVSTR